ncbi:MAG: DsrE family protein [Anaerolineae bacterium]
MSMEPIDHLAVIWSSGDPAVAHKVCFMYTHNAKRQGWFEHVTLIVWGPSAELLTRDESLQQRIRAMIADGVVIEACKACSDAYGVSDQLSALGIDVKYMGTPLTQMLKQGWRVLTF